MAVPSVAAYLVIIMSSSGRAPEVVTTLFSLAFPSAVMLTTILVTASVTSV